MRLTHIQTRRRTKARILNILTGCMLGAISNLGVADQTVSNPLYIDAGERPFTELLDIISTKTGYQIELAGTWPDTPVSTPLQGVSLEAGLKKIIKELGTDSHILVLDDSQKTVKIASISPGKDPDEKMLRKFAPASSDEPLSPPLPSGEPVLTASQLSAIKDSYRTQRLNKQLDTELSPPGTNEQNLTAPDLEEIKNTYRQELMSQDSSTIIEPATAYSGALTRGDLDRFKAEYSKRLTQESPDTIISEATEDSPGMTRGQLDTFKAAYLENQVVNYSRISPSPKVTTR